MSVWPKRALNASTCDGQNPPEQTGAQSNPRRLIVRNKFSRGVTFAFGMAVLGVKSYELRIKIRQWRTGVYCSIKSSL